MNKVLLDDMINKVSKENILNLIILKAGEVVIDYNKKDEYRDKPFKINSCTKSILSALIGIAIDNGLIESVHQSIPYYFDELKAEDRDNKKKDITIYHLLTMTSGISWPEFDNWEFISKLSQSPDWVNFILDRPMEFNPGEKFNYNSGGSHLLSAIISKATGMNADAYAQKHIFERLGIKNINWISDPQGYSNGGFGIEMSAYDMAKIGSLYLNKGKIKEDSLISEWWIQQSLEPRILASRAMGHYGYQWWIKDFKYLQGSIQAYYAMGIGGQFIFVVPSMDMVVVFISNNYNDTFRPLYYMKNYILKLF